MFQRQRTRRRLTWACLALAQLFVVAVVPAAEAALERGEPMGAHLESESAAGCALRHDHRFCQLCRASSLDALTRAAHGGDALGEPIVARIAPGPAPVTLPDTTACRTSLGPRAPPGA
jgi:hypothetical protein